MDKTFLTTSQAAKICHVTRFTILNWVKQGRLRATATAGGHQRIRQEDLLKLLKKTQPVTPTAEFNNSAVSILPCWEAPKQMAKGRHRCPDCLVFKEQINRCFLTVRSFGKEKVLCGIDCLKCEYFATYYPQQKRTIEGMRQKAVAKLASTVPHSDKADIADFLKKGLFVSGRCIAKVSKKFTRAPRKNNRHEKNG